MKRNRWLLLSIAATLFLGAAARAQGPAGPGTVSSPADAKPQLKRTRSKAIKKRSRPAWASSASVAPTATAWTRPASAARTSPRSGRRDAATADCSCTLRNGVPNTEMPSVGVRTPDHEIWQILAYLRTLAAPAPTDPPRGNAENGERLFRANCASCHRVDGRGGRLGPDLSRIGNARSREVMVRRIRGAVEENGAGYAPVTLTTPSGQQVQAREEERGPLLGAGHGHARADPGLRQSGPERSEGRDRSRRCPRSAPTASTKASSTTSSGT